MPSKIVYTNISPKRFLSGYSRYGNSKVIYWGWPPKLTFTTYKKKSTSIALNDKFGVIPPGCEYRPDKISQEVYGAPDFWWKILEANGMKDIFEFKTGLTIRLPTDILG